MSSPLRPEPVHAAEVLASSTAAMLSGVRADLVELAPDDRAGVRRIDELLGVLLGVGVLRNGAS